MEIKNSEFFRNIKRLPPIDTREFDQLVEWEKSKCLGGVTVGGVFFSGWLYWHINHWWIFSDEVDQYGNDIRKEKLPDLRDNEWERSEGMELAKRDKVGYLEVGGRQGGKSELEASITGYTSILFENSQSVIIGGNKPDIDLITEKISVGLKRLWQGLSIPLLDKDWRKPTVRLGYKDKNNEDHVWSYIMVRNTEDGLRTEAPAGTTPKSVVMDEIGKYPFAATYTAAKPALIGKNGMRCVPILVGTGGSFFKGKDAERYFNNPEAQGFYGFDNPETGGKSGKFLSGLYRQDCKYETNMADYLQNEKGLYVADRSELEKITIWVSDKEKALALIKKERALKAKDPDRTEYLKEIMYRPLTVQECFLTSAKNFYNGELARMQREKNIQNDIKGEAVELWYDGSKINVKQTPHKAAISSYPTKTNEDKDAPIIIWEHPIPNPPYGLYVAGVDPYRFENADSSDSLGAIYIFKRMHDIHSEKYQDCFVASYVARPETKSKWNEQAKLLLKYYNAIALVENDENSFCDYMLAQGEGHMIADQPSWLTEILPNSHMKRNKGISRSSQKVRNELRDIFKTYMEEKLTDIKGVGGEVIGQVLGVNQIYDNVLLEEISSWNEDGNFDREVAASLAVAQARKMDRIRIHISDVEEDNRFKPYSERKKTRTGPFSSQSKMFSIKRHKIFD